MPAPQSSAKAGFDPNQLRDPHTGEWIDVPGLADVLEEVREWVESAPKGGWGGIRGHSTTPENADAIRADGFDLGRSPPDGELGPGIYFSSFAPELNPFGEGHVLAGIRLTKPASPQVVNEVRQEVREEMGPNPDPSEFKRRFLAKMKALGHDGAISDQEGTVVAVYDPKAVKVIRPKKRSAMLHKTLEAQATITELGEFTAIAAAYSVDRANERILPGAFKASIERWQGSGKQIPLHWDHMGDAKNIIGSVDPATMRETDEGLEVKGQLDLEDSEVAREAWRSMKKNSIGLSFGYLVTADGKADDGIRELKAVDVFEVSVTPAPMNPDTRFIDMKSNSENPGKGFLIWQKWAERHIVEPEEKEEDGKLEEPEVKAEEEPEVKCCETCGNELTAEQVKAIEDARDEEPVEAKSEAQDPLRKRYDEIALELSTRGVEPSEPPKVEEKSTEEPPSMEALRRDYYDLMLELHT